MIESLLDGDNDMQVGIWKIKKKSVLTEFIQIKLAGIYN